MNSQTKAAQLPRWNEITAVFGGCFDPPHAGHKKAVAGLFEKPGVSKVLILPCPTPAHKSTVASAEDRVEMARRCFINSNSDIQMELCELERARKSPQHPTYSFDTLQELRQTYSTAIGFVIGADELLYLPKWYRFPEVLSLSHWIVLERKPFGSHPVRQVLQEWLASGLIAQTSLSDTWQIRTLARPTGQLSGPFLKVVSTEAADLSSSEIRKSFSLSGACPADALDPEVLEYIKVRRLYGT